MNQITKQCVGIDCSKDELVSCLASLMQDMEIKQQVRKVFSNDPAGISRLVNWAKKHSDESLPLSFIVEATGVYHEKLAEHLFDQGFHISVVLPRRVHAFTKSLQTKTITDSTASQAIAQFGLLKKLDKWHKPNKVYRLLRNLTREREQLLQQRTTAKNQLHAEQNGAWADQNALKRLKKRIRFYDEQMGQVEADINWAISQDKSLKERLEKVQTIKGVSLITAVTIVAETDGFNLIRNSRQLVSYAGLDVIQKQSGTSVRGKPRISHRGNRHIRRALYLPALSAIRHDPFSKQHYHRLVSRHGVKMKAAVSVQRKLLILMYILWKNQSVYDPHYREKCIKKSGSPSLDPPTELDLICSFDNTNIT